MRYKIACLAVFWVSVILTLIWGATGYPLLAALSFALGVFFTAQGFLAAKAEDCLPSELGRTVCQMGFLSATSCARNPGKGFEKIQILVDAKRPKMVTLFVRTKAAFWNTRKRAEKHKKELSRIFGFFDAELSEQEACVRFSDEPSLSDSVRKALKVLAAIEK